MALLEVLLVGAVGAGLVLYRLWEGPGPGQLPLGRPTRAFLQDVDVLRPWEVVEGTSPVECVRAGSWEDGSGSSDPVATVVWTPSARLHERGGLDASRWRPIVEEVKRHQRFDGPYPQRSLAGWPGVGASPQRLVDLTWLVTGPVDQVRDSLYLLAAREPFAAHERYGAWALWLFAHDPRARGLAETIPTSATTRTRAIASLTLRDAGRAAAMIGQTPPLEPRLRGPVARLALSADQLPRDVLARCLLWCPANDPALVRHLGVQAPDHVHEALHFALQQAQGHDDGALAHRIATLPDGLLPSASLVLATSVGAHDTRRAAAKALISQSRTDAAPDLLTILDTLDGDEQSTDLVRVLGHLAGPEAVVPLRAFLERHPDAPARREAEIAIARIQERVDPTSVGGISVSASVGRGGLTELDDGRGGLSTGSEDPSRG